jgi:hypothetical protein
MKKMIFITVAAIALLAGCVKNEEGGVNPASPDVINFALSTAGAPSTRAAVVGLPGLQAAANGFVVYGTSAATPAAWYTTGGPIDGSNNYRFAGTAWDWAGAKPTWPVVMSGYPMQFYAWYSSVTGTTGVGTVSASVGIMPIITLPFVVPDLATDQADFLVAKATASSKPAGGKLNMTFDHALSKINFGIIAGINTTSFVQSVAVHNVGFQRTFDLVTGDWTSAQPPTFNKSYTYYGTVTDGSNGLSVIDVRDFPGIDGIAAAPVLTANSTPQVAATGNLMLMPQTAVTWQPVPNTPAPNAYIGLVYRLESNDDFNAVGYRNANDHSNYTGSAAATANYTGPLFMKVGFPFITGVASFTWEKGKGYNYNIYLGTPNASNGYLVDKFYYDDKGNRTDLTVLGSDPGGPINPADNTIHFFVDVRDWSDAPFNIQ